MVKLKVEQSIQNKLFVKLKKSPTKSFEILSLVIILYHVSVFLIGINDFLKIWKRLKTMNILANLQGVIETIRNLKKIVQKDLSILTIADKVNTKYKICEMN